MQRFSVAYRHDSEPSWPSASADFFLRLIRSRILQVCALAIFLCVVLGFSIPAQAQSNSLTDAAADRAWQITSYAVEAGLGAQRVFDIAFESDGTAWLAAADGLRRVDGFTG